MADVPGKFYRATKVRTGVAPSSAGSIEGEVLPPVNPPGSSLNSVGLTMPSAFIVSNSPLTSNGTIGVAGAGTVAQYIRGDGSLADFPESSGGGSSVSYYLNGSVDQGTIGGIAYKELSKVPILGAGTDFTINADGYIASFITDAGDPSLLEIPGGNWNFETYFSASSSGGTPTFYVELYKVSGTTATLIASSSSSPELIAFGTNLTPYFSTLAVPTTTLALTDRLAVRYYVTHSGRTITLHTENNHLCQIITTFTTGLTALNGLTAQVQNFAVGTSGTDFNIASATATHTFNLPTASATNRGALSSADWSLFTQAYNDKINSAAVTGTTTKTLTLTQQDGGTITASWSDLNTDAVLSVFGRTGAVVAANGDYTTAQVTESGNLYYTDARSRAALSFAAGSGAYNTSTGVITIPTNNNQIANGAGYITAETDTLQSVILRNGTTNTGFNIFNSNDTYTSPASTNVPFIYLYNTGTTSTSNAVVAIRTNSATGGDPILSFDIGGVIGWSMGIDNSDEDKFKIARNWLALDSETRFSMSLDGTAVFTGNLSAANLSGTNTGNVTIGTANGLSLSGQQISLGLASGSANGALSSTDWTTFNNKQNALTNPVTGTGTSGQVAYFNGTTSITSESNLFWDATNDRLGIGTPTPSSTLDVNGIATVGSGTDGNGLRIRSTNGTPFRVIDPTSAGGASSVNIGSIGTAIGDARIHATNVLFLSNDGNNQRMTILANGNVGMGTPTPSVASGLGFVLNSGANQGRIAIKTSSTGDAAGDGLQIGMSGIDAFIEQRENADLTFATNATEKLRITSGGNVLIGNPPAADNGARLQVNGAAVITSNINIHRNGSGTVGSGGYYTLYNAATTDGMLWQLNASNNIDFWGLTSNSFTASPVITLTRTGAATFSSSVTAGGSFITPNGFGLLTRNAANTANRNVIFLNSSNQISIGNEADINRITLGTASSLNGFRMYSAGNIGIGPTTTDFGETFMLATFKAGSSNYLRVQTDNNASYDAGGLFTDGTNNVYYGMLRGTTGLTGAFSVTTGGTTRFNITSGGNVGIGTQSPSTFLHVLGANTTDRGQLSIQSNNVSNAAKVTWYYHTTNQGEIGTTSGDFYALAVNNFLFYAGGSPRMTITSGGNVGIGPNTANYKLNVFDTGVIISSGQANWSTNTRGIMVDNINNGDESVGIWFRTGTNHLSGISGQRRDNIAGWGTDLRFYTHEEATVNLTTAQERMRVTSSGNLLVGATTTIGPVQGRVDVLYPGNTSYGMNIRTTTQDGIAISFVNSVGSQVGNIYTNFSSTAYNTSSDYRLKEDLKEFNGIDLINKIKTYDFKWKSDKSRSYGVVAHELQEVIDYAVYGQKDSLTMQGVDYSKLVPILIKAIQEQQVQIDKLKN